jgi:probable selenium-dependent hydroxylase accessory protein YqeC
MEDGVALSDILLKDRPRMISFVGAGGKTGMMMALAREMAEQKGPGSVLVTTTTHLRMDDIPKDFQLVRLKGKEVDRKELKDGWSAGKIMVVHSKVEEDGRIKGIGRKAVAGMASRGRTLLVEADGAFRLPLKRLRPHEPVIPKGPLPALVCIVTGLDALGRPLGPDSCFNDKGVVDKGIACKGDAMTPAVIRDILYRERGYMDVIPEGQRAVLVLNKVDGKRDRLKGTALARELFHAGLSDVMMSSVKGRKVRCRRVDNSGHKVVGVVLAAGSGKRFGGQKLLQKVGKGTMIEKVVRNALSCKGFDKVVVVLGHEGGAVGQALKGLKDDARLVFVDNLDHAKGMSTSMRAGIEIAAMLGADAVAVLLGDMPMLRTALMDKVVEGYRSSCSRICLPRVGNRGGHPVVLGKDLFDDLRKVEGDIGARDVVGRYLDWTRPVDVRADRDQMDIDFITDLERYRERGRR